MVMIVEVTGDLEQAYNNASHALWMKCGHSIVTPRIFGHRWAKEYGCRHVYNPMSPHTCLEFDDGQDYLMFMLRWS